MIEVHGQHDGRGERVRQTAEWLGAHPLHDDGSPKTLDPEPNLHVVQAHVEMVRATLAAGVRRIIVSETDDLARQAIKQMLSPDERACCVFEPDDPPLEGPVVVGATRSHE